MSPAEMSYVFPHIQIWVSRTRVYVGEGVVELKNLCEIPQVSVCFLLFDDDLRGFSIHIHENGEKVPQHKSREACENNTLCKRDALSYHLPAAEQLSEVQLP